MADNSHWEIEPPNGPLAQGMSIRDIIQFFLSNFLILAGGLAIGLCLGLIAQNAITPAYQSKGNFLVDEIPFVQTSGEVDSQTRRDVVQTLIMSTPNRDMQAAIERRLKIGPGRIAFSDLDLPVKLTGPIPKANLSVTPLKESRIGVIEATSQSPEFAADVVNAMLAELRLYNQIGGKFKTLQLDLQLSNTKAESTLKQLLDLTAQRIKLERENAELDNYLQQKLPLEGFPAFSKDATLNNIKTQLILVDSEYQSVASNATRGSRLVGRKAELDSLQVQLTRQAERLAAALRSEYEITLTQEKNLQEDFRKTKDHIDRLSADSARLAQSFGDPRAMEQLAAEPSDQPSGPANIIVVVDSATPQSKPVRPKLVLNLLLGGIFGLAVGVGLAMLRTVLDNSIRSATQLEARLGLPCLAVLPRRPSLAAGSRHEAIFDHPVYPISLGFLKSHLLHASLKEKRGIISGFTPASKKFTSSQLVTDLAILLAQAEKKTLVVDLNFAAPQTAAILGIEVKKGLGAWLASDDAIEDYIDYSTVRELAVLSARPQSRDMEDLLSRRSLATALTELSGQWDFILIDSPSILADWSLMLTLPPGAPLIVVADWKKTSIDAVTQTLGRARGPRWDVQGVVLLNAPRKLAS